MNDSELAEAGEGSRWVTLETLADVAQSYGATACQPHKPTCQNLGSFMLRHRRESMGPIALSDVEFGTDLRVTWGKTRSTYQVNIVKHGRLEVEHGGRTAVVAGQAAIISPHGDTTMHWAAKTRALCVEIDSSAVVDALTETLGRKAVRHVEFAPIMPTSTGGGQAWTVMLEVFSRQLFQRDGLLHQPIVAMPFIDSLLRGLLTAANHLHRDAMEHPWLALPQPIRTAIGIMEAEPHLPMTVESLAARTGVSARSLQLGFRSMLDITPMAYLREVRLRRAHQALLESNPSRTTVKSIAYQWRFLNQGRFAAMHTARYGETPSDSLRRNKFHGQPEARGSASHKEPIVPACREAHPAAASISSGVVENT